MRGCKKCGKPPYLCACKKIKNIEKLVFPYFYHGEKIKFAIYKLKKANLYYINEFFAKGMYNSFKICDKIKIGDIDFITCAPRKQDSIKLYGYNQTETLAKIISKYMKVNYMPVIEASELYDTEQKSLNQSERALNVKNKFTVVKSIKNNKNAAIILKDKNILIIDDVVTTGSTLSECARIIKNMGAENVYALCIASVYHK
jgi:ComF family protein